jgi:hypothetical protein
MKTNVNVNSGSESLNLNKIFNKNLILIWKKKDKILEGIMNSVFKREHVELIASSRLALCQSNTCNHYDPKGVSPAAVVKGVPSCASCGCKIQWKIRALSDSCPLRFWGSVLSHTEESVLKEKLGIIDDDEDAH